MTPVLLLVLCAIVGGGFVAVATDRLMPRRAATAFLAGGLVTGTRLGRWLRARANPATATGLGLTVAVVVVVCGGVILGVLAYLADGNATLHHLDSDTAVWGRHHATRLGTRILTLITDLGGWPAVALIAVAVVAVELIRAPSRYLVPFLVVVVGGDELITIVIKDVVDRARPTLNPIARTLGPSFPSGHASTAAAVYAALALLVARRRGVHARALLAGTAAAIAIAVAASRVLLDVHWLSDVIAGLSLGWAWCALCVVAFGGRLVRFGAAAEHPADSKPATASPARALTRVHRVPPDV